MCGQLRIGNAWVLLVLVGMLFGITGPAAAVVVNFPDPNLEAEVRDSLGIPAPTPITDTDMETMGTFDASSSNIVNIQGMEYGINLTSLAMFINQISDISPVAGLTDLTELYLGDNQINDISPVAGLTNLTEVSLNRNRLKEISAVAGLTNLRTLDLGNNGIYDISAVSGLTNLETRRARTDDGCLATGGFDLVRRVPAAAGGEVGDEALQATDGNGL